MCLLFRIRIFIKKCSLDDKLVKDFLELAEIGTVSWHLINTISKSGWNRLIVNKNNRSFQSCILLQFVIKPMTAPNIPTPLSDSSRLNKSKLTNTINNKKSYTQTSLFKPINNKKSYTQTSKINVEDVLHIKNAFPTLSSNKIIDINNINNKSNTIKPKINMTIK